MLDLKEKDIVIFYKNLEKLIGKDMSSKIKNEMADQLIDTKQKTQNLSLCPFCLENRSNCVILFVVICYVLNVLKILIGVKCLVLNVKTYKIYSIYIEYLIF